MSIATALGNLWSRIFGSGGIQTRVQTFGTDLPPAIASQGQRESFEADRAAGRSPVASTWIGWIKFERENPGDRNDMAKGKLSFYNYRAKVTLNYSGVPYNEYLKFLFSGSKGQYYNRYIKGRYTYMGES